MMIHLYQRLIVLFLILSGLFANTGILAQNGSPEPYYLEVNSIDPYEFAEIVKTFRSFDNMSIERGCVPAEIIVLEFSDNVNRDALLIVAQNKIKEITDIPVVRALTDFSSDEYFSTCASMRGSQN